ncbi:MAG: hypothetical protein WC551_11035, partial [Patescibacteria group bacterium]
MTTTGKDAGVVFVRAGVVCHLSAQNANLHFVLQRSLPKLIAGLRKLGVPAECLEWHGHNDFHKVQACAAA